MTTSEQIDSYIESISDWRGDKLKTLRKLILAADPEMKEEWKWDVPVFTHDGLVCAISAFNEHVKINFFSGAALPDPNKLFNSGLESKRNRSINFSESDRIDESAISDLVKAAVAKNTKK